MCARTISRAVLGLLAIGLVALVAVAAYGQAPTPPTPAPEGDRTPMALRILDSGMILVAGSEAPTSLFVVEFSPMGARLSNERMLLPAAPEKVAIHADGTVAVAAQTMTGKGDIWVMKYHPDSALPIWLNPAIYNGSGNGPDKITGLGFDALGNVFVSASSLNSVNRYVFVTLKLDAITGVRHWVKEEPTLPTPGSLTGANVPTAMSFNPDQDVQIAGKIWDGTDYNFGINCYANPTGIKEFPTAVFDSAPLALDVPTAMITDSFDHINVTGYSQPLKGKSVYSTLQYECKTGALRWGPVTFSGPRNSYPTAIALDAKNNVFVTGVSEDHFGRDNFVTVKYHLLNGHQEWAATYNAFNQFGSYPVGIAVDANSDIAVTGMVTTQFSDTDFVTMKYNGKTGALIWGPVLFDFKNHTQDVPAAIAVDPQGNFVVTGSVETPNGTRTVTVKYDGLTGSRLWIR